MESPLFLGDAGWVTLHCPCCSAITRSNGSSPSQAETALAAPTFNATDRTLHAACRRAGHMQEFWPLRPLGTLRDKLTEWP